MTPYGPYTLSNDGRNYDIDAVFFTFLWVAIMKGFRVGAEQSEAPASVI